MGNNANAHPGHSARESGTGGFALAEWNFNSLGRQFAFAKNEDRTNK